MAPTVKTRLFHLAILLAVVAAIGMLGIATKGNFTFAKIDNELWNKL